jgi:hypothetical protein
LLSDSHKQDEFSLNVPQVNVVTELINEWFDSAFVPEFEWLKEYFSPEEWRVLMKFHCYFDKRVDELPRNYSELRENPIWKGIQTKAQDALSTLNWDKLNTDEIEIEYD